MESLRSLSAGPKLVLVAAPLLFVSLFLTWQKLVVDFGPAGSAETLLDGWDLWGLLIGLLAVSLTVLVVVVYVTEVELPENVPWSGLLLGGGIAVLVLTVVKTLLDADSAWASYAGIVLAALVALGCYETWAEESGRASFVGRIRRRGLSSAA